MAISVAEPGSGPGAKKPSGCSSTRGSTVTSMIVARISAPETPSMAAWWTLV